MRIISDFKDYYDVSQQYGQDQTVIFNRKKIKFDLDKEKLPEVVVDLQNIARELIKNPSGNRWIFNPHSLPFSELSSKEHRNINVYPRCVFFCGQVYQLLKVSNTAVHLNSAIPFHGVDENHFFFDEKSFFEHCEKLGVNDLDKKMSYEKITKRKAIEQFFAAKSAPDVRDWMIEKKVITAYWQAGEVIINPILREIQFFKKFDAYTAYQELDIWISGTLSFPHEILIEIEDKYKIQQHGFDKWSFRKRPEEKV